MEGKNLSLFVSGKNEFSSDACAEINPNLIVIVTEVDN